MFLLHVSWVMFWCLNKGDLLSSKGHTVNTLCLYDGILTAAQCKD